MLLSEKIFKIVAFPGGLDLVGNYSSDWELLNCVVKVWLKNAFISSVLKCLAVSDVEEIPFIIQSSEVLIFTSSFDINILCSLSTQCTVFLVCDA